MLPAKSNALMIRAIGLQHPGLSGSKLHCIFLPIVAWKGHSKIFCYRTQIYCIYELVILYHKSYWTYNRGVRLQIRRSVLAKIDGGTSNRNTQDQHSRQNSLQNPDRYFLPHIHHPSFIYMICG